MKCNAVIMVLYKMLPYIVHVSHNFIMCVIGSIDIDRAPMLYRDLCQASESLVVANHLHLLYLVTPYDLAVNIKPTWLIYLDEVSNHHIRI